MLANGWLVSERIILPSILPKDGSCVAVGGMDVEVLVGVGGIGVAVVVAVAVGGIAVAGTVVGCGGLLQAVRSSIPKKT